MPIELFYLLVFIALLAIAFIPDLFPRCSCCGKIKFKAFFRISRTVKIHPGYAGRKSVCTKCCRLYGIETFQDFQTVMNIRRKLEINLDLTQDRIPKLPSKRSGKLKK